MAGAEPGVDHLARCTDPAQHGSVSWYDATAEECTACSTVSTTARVRVVHSKVKVDQIRRHTAADAAVAQDSAQ